MSFENLERRDLLAVFTVTNLNDAVVNTPAAVGTLRQAIFDANASPAVADEIVFAPALSGAIQLTSVGSQVDGSSALFVSSPITIRGNANGIILQPSAAVPEMRLFHVSSTGNLTLESLMLTGGIARGEDGDVPGQAGFQGRGGAILNLGTLEIIGSTLYGNAAIGGNGLNAPAGPGIGGAIANDGGTVTIKNSTISGNSVTSGLGTSAATTFGGGVHSLNGLTRIYNSTISNNLASSGRQVYVIFAFGTATVELFSSIVAQSDAPVQTTDFVAAGDVGGELNISAANNIVRTQVGLSISSYENADPLLGPLADNGGATLTHGITLLSPAIDGGTNAFSLTTDQRGATFSRSIGNGVDIGAFELQSGPELPGDYNRDQFVNAADYVMWRKTMGATVSTFQGADGNGSGEIDPEDYGVWVENFAESLTLGSGGDSLDIAEPSAAGVDDGYLSEPTSLGLATSEKKKRDATNETVEALLVDQQPLAENTRDKALLAVLVSWDAAARGERTLLGSM